jgi:DNA-binding CsgD family transcriptional regulator
MNATLTRRETEAVLFLTEYEVVKVAADRRCVSEHTQKNQIRSAMEKLGVCTQVGLIKEFFHLIYGVRFDLQDARQMTATCLLCLFIFSMGNVDSFVRRTTRSKRPEVEIITESI